MTQKRILSRLGARELSSDEILKVNGGNNDQISLHPPGEGDATYVVTCFPSGCSDMEPDYTP